MDPVEAAEVVSKAERKGMALEKSTSIIKGASFLAEEQPAADKTFALEAGDDVMRTLLQVEGEMNSVREPLNMSSTRVALSRIRHLKQEGRSTEHLTDATVGGDAGRKASSGSRGFLNTLGLSIPLPFMSVCTDLDWSTVLVAVDSSYLPASAISHHALDVLDEDSPQEVLDLAIIDVADRDDSFFVRPMVMRLAEGESEEKKDVAEDRLQFIVLKWIYENKGRLEDPWGAVDFVYDDFGFPESMIGFVPWMPFSDGERPLLPGESSYDRMSSNWERYLEREGGRFAKEGAA